MKNGIKITSLQILILAIIISCSRYLVIDNIKSEGYSIKSIFSDGKTSSKFIFNEGGKIIESQSFYFCNKYIYDNNGRLIKQEIAVDPDIASSTIHIKSVLMTSRNSTFTGNYIFEYQQYCRNQFCAI